MGSTVIAEAVAMGHVTPDDVDSLVLSTLGLFYEAPLDGRLKIGNRVLERLSQPGGTSLLSAVDPRGVGDGAAVASPLATGTGEGCTKHGRARSGRTKSRQMRQSSRVGTAAAMSASCATG